jgi:hypothetical protein
MSTSGDSYAIGTEEGPHVKIGKTTFERLATELDLIRV